MLKDRADLVEENGDGRLIGLRLLLLLVRPLLHGVLLDMPTLVFLSVFTNS